MEWTILNSDLTTEDPTGVEGFIKRMDAEYRAGGVPIEGFRIVKSGMEMFNITRQIEADKVLAGPSKATLYVGFQNVDKFINEYKRYTNITESGINVVGFGEGNVAGEVDVISQWVALSEDHKAFENQWYLISTEPEPFIFIGWETSDSSQFGLGGVSTPGKEFKGFISDDLRIVNAAIAHLERVRIQSGPKEAVNVEQLTDNLGFSVNKVMVLTDDGRNKNFLQIREESLSLASKFNAEVVSYDTSAISYLVNPYPSELYEKENSKPLDGAELLTLGRQYLSDQIEAYKSHGIAAKAVLPTEHGFGHMSEWAEQEGVDMIMMPASMIKPGLVGRLQGYNLSNLLSSTDKPVLVVDKSGAAKILINDLAAQTSVT